MNSYLRLVLNPREFWIRFMWHYSPMWKNEELYLKILYRLNLGRSLNLKNPKRFTEKLQWLKLYYHNPMITNMADKYEVKKYLTDRIGSEYVIPAYGVWNTFDEIDFDSLPDQFILKCTHDSGSFYICKDKKTFNKEAARAKLEGGLRRSYYWNNREWVYKNIKPRIIAEKYIDSLGQTNSLEYKLSCFNGKVKFVTLCGGIAHAAYELRSNDHFTPDWERLNWYAFYKPKGGDIPKPAIVDKIIELSEKLAKDLPHVRVDWYVHNGQLYFGEFTFYTWAGFPIFTPDEWDEKLGSWIQLPEKML